MRLNSVVILVAFLALLISFWQRNDLPANLKIVDDTREEPLQVRTKKKPFDALFNDVRYRVEPEYAYDLSGVVVSYRHHEGKSRMHRRANDHLNMLDVCVVWGDNAGNPILQQFDFWNGIFTCVFKTGSNEAWAAFNQHQLSNNHLISDNPAIRDRVLDIAIGDQIRVRGQLASYSSAAGGKRGTSTTRTDTGDGACETIYVEEFQILEAAVSPWRMSMYASASVLALALLVHFRRPYRPYADRD